MLFLTGATLIEDVGLLNTEQVNNHFSSLFWLPCLLQAKTSSGIGKQTFRSRKYYYNSTWRVKSSFSTEIKTAKDRDTEGSPTIHHRQLPSSKFTQAENKQLSMSTRDRKCCLQKKQNKTKHLFLVFLKVKTIFYNFY